MLYQKARAIKKNKVLETGKYSAAPFSLCEKTFLGKFRFFSKKRKKTVDKSISF